MLAINIRPMIAKTELIPCTASLRRIFVCSCKLCVRMLRVCECCPPLRYNPQRQFGLECVGSVLGEINGPSKEAKSEEAKQAAALDDDRLEATEGFGGAAQGVRDCPSTASHGARCPVEGSHRGNIPRDEMTSPLRCTEYSAQQQFRDELIATSLAMVLMFRAVPFFAAGITSLDWPIPR
jgi:hypothetical protein